jgi:hypothetical protein
MNNLEIYLHFFGGKNKRNSHLFGDEFYIFYTFLEIKIRKMTFFWR